MPGRRPFCCKGHASLGLRHFGGEQERSQVSIFSCCHKLRPLSRTGCGKPCGGLLIPTGQCALCALITFTRFEEVRKPFADMSVPCFKFHARNIGCISLARATSKVQGEVLRLTTIKRLPRAIIRRAKSARRVPQHLDLGHACAQPIIMLVEPCAAVFLDRHVASQTHFSSPAGKVRAHSRSV